MLERKVNTALVAITHWIESAGLNLATSKMEALLFILVGSVPPPST